MDLRSVPFDHPDAVALIAAVQQEYVTRYGGQDSTPVDPAEFAPPRGTFVVAYRDGTPVACGGWRIQDGGVEGGLVDGDAEIKRMYVTPEARGAGFARAVLAELERRAVAAGRRRMVLETGTKQPEALALYRSVGYTEITKFGVYRCEENSRCLGRVLD